MTPEKKKEITALCKAFVEDAQRWFSGWESYVQSVGYGKIKDAKDTGIVVYWVKKAPFKLPQMYEFDGELYSVHDGGVMDTPQALKD